MLRWPTRASAAIHKLFEPLQDVDVYVEDFDDEAFYRELLNHATSGKIRIARVFGLGGRAKVIAAAQVHDHARRAALFIIDGDLMWVRGDSETLPRATHRHEAYCVENLLICERGLSHLLAQDTATTTDQASSQLNFDEWRSSIELVLGELFSAFATAHFFNATVPTVSRGAGVLCTEHKSPRRLTLDPTKVAAARDEVLAAARAIAGARADEIFESTLLRIRALTDPLAAVSGKDFLLPLIDFRFAALGCRIRRKALRMRLAGAVDRGRFARISTALEEAAKGIV